MYCNQSKINYNSFNSKITHNSPLYINSQTDNTIGKEVKKKEVEE